MKANLALRLGASSNPVFAIGLGGFDERLVAERQNQRQVPLQLG
jgi:hypothetical protein